jgi:NAD(P)-dependent dehydrogenase (short-subunit alcohol dehydrogenase family)
MRKPLSETSAADWQRIIGINLTLPGILVSSYIGGMPARGWGRILLFGGTNTGSIRGFTTTAPYVAAKTALGTLAKSVAKNASAYGVTCNVICPGLTDTEYMDDEAKRYNAENAPGGNVLSPAEIAAFAASVMQNPALNGGIFPIDHGIEVYKV